MKIISVDKGFHVLGGQQLFGKFKSLKHCMKVCAVTPTCLSGDYNPWLHKCYQHSNFTACNSLQSHSQFVHFSKVPCGQQRCFELIHRKKVAHTRLPSVGFRSWSRFLAVSLQVTWVINPTVGCHYFPPGLQLPPQPLTGLLPIIRREAEKRNRFSFVCIFFSTWRKLVNFFAYIRPKEIDL